MYLPATYVVALVLTAAVAAAMLWRRRSAPSYVVAAGAASQVVGVLLQLTASPVALTQADAAIDLGSTWRLGTIFTAVGSLAFLSGLLWHFVGAHRAGSRGESNT
jgi:hypothetical protein